MVISSIPNADRYLASKKSQKLTKIGDRFCGVFLNTLKPMTPKNEFFLYSIRNFPAFGFPSIPNTDQ